MYIYTYMYICTYILFWKAGRMLARACGLKGKS